MMMLISLMRARALEGSAASKMVLPFGRIQPTSRELDDPHLSVKLAEALRGSDTGGFAGF